MFLLEYENEQKQERGCAEYDESDVQAEEQPGEREKSDTERGKNGADDSQKLKHNKNPKMK